MGKILKMLAHLKMVHVAIVTMILSGTMAVVDAAYSKQLSNLYEYIGSGNMQKAVDVLIIFSILIAVKTILKYGGFLYRGDNAEKKSAILRTELFEKSVRADVTALQEVNIDEIINTGMNSTGFLKDLLSSAATVSSIIFDLICSYALMLGNNIELTIIITALMLLLLVVNYAMGRYFTKLAEEKSKASIGIISHYNRIRNYSIIKSFCKEKEETDNMGRSSDILRDVSNKKRRIATAMGSTMGVINGMIIISIFLYAIKTNMKVSDIILFSSLFENVFAIFAYFTDIIEQISEVISVNNRAYRLLSIKCEKDGTIELESFNNSIEFKNVAFSYKKSENVLHDINIEIPKGKKVGIYGPSGEGKSTFINLINRFFSVDRGGIYIDSINIADLTANSLRSKIGIVSQDIYLFEGSIEDNIRYGNQNASKEDVIDAAKKANAYEFISKFKDGFDSNIGRDGIKLSGGQKQRISIARMILANPDIIILDEATSKLDNESEKVVQEAIDKYQEDKTVISIAHRLSTLDNCDYLIGIKNHTIYEKGTKQDLERDKNSLYYKLSHM